MLNCGISLPIFISALLLIGNVSVVVKANDGIDLAEMKEALDVIGKTGELVVGQNKTILSKLATIGGKGGGIENLLQSLSKLQSAVGFIYSIVKGDSAELVAIRNLTEQVSVQFKALTQHIDNQIAKIECQNLLIDYKNNVDVKLDTLSQLLKYVLNAEKAGIEHHQQLESLKQNFEQKCNTVDIMEIMTQISHAFFKNCPLSTSESTSTSAAREWDTLKCSSSSVPRNINELPLCLLDGVYSGRGQKREPLLALAEKALSDMFRLLMLAPFCIREEKSKEGERTAAGGQQQILQSEKGIKKYDDEQGAASTPAANIVMEDIVHDFVKIAAHIRAWIEITLKNAWPDVFVKQTINGGTMPIEEIRQIEEGNLSLLKKFAKVITHEANQRGESGFTYQVHVWHSFEEQFLGLMKQIDIGPLHKKPFTKEWRKRADKCVDPDFCFTKAHSGLFVLISRFLENDAKTYLHVQAANEWLQENREKLNDSLKSEVESQKFDNVLDKMYANFPALNYYFGGTILIRRQTSDFPAFLKPFPVSGLLHYLLGSKDSADDTIGMIFEKAHINGNEIDTWSVVSVVTTRDDILFIVEHAGVSFVTHTTLIFFPGNSAHFENFDKHNLLPMPYSNTINMPAKVTIAGAPKIAADEFVVNFHVNELPMGQIALHFNPRFSQNVVVRNSYHEIGTWSGEKPNCWGKQECRGKFPFITGKPFIMEFVMDYDKIEIKIDGNLFTTFEYRSIKHSLIHLMEIKGDIMLKKVEIESNGQRDPLREYDTNSLLLLPYNQKIHVPAKATIIGALKEDGKNFVMNFRVNNGQIALHFNPRLQIFVDGKFFTDFHYRAWDHYKITNIEINGDIMLKDIQVEQLKVDAQKDYGAYLPVPHHEHFILMPAKVTVVGEAKASAKWFTINFMTYTGHYQSDIAMHFNARFNENVLVLNSHHDAAKKGWWANEQRISLPFVAGNAFRIIFQVYEREIHIIVNGHYLTKFYFRQNHKGTSLVSIYGDVLLEIVRVEELK